MDKELGVDGVWLNCEQHSGRIRLIAGGDWNMHALHPITKLIQAIDITKTKQLEVDLAAVRRLDSIGAQRLYQLLLAFHDKGAEIDLSALEPAQRNLLQAIADRPEVKLSPAAKAEFAGLSLLRRIGEAAEQSSLWTIALIGFLGQVSQSLLYVFLRPRLYRWNALTHQLDRSLLGALPIVGLISLLIGIVLAFQGAVQLQRFGAEIFVVNLIAISVLREVGILLTAIIVAGRSGSAFAAEIGSMKLNQELDAMQAMGLDPIQILVLPRILALTIALPLLALFADFLGLLGGGLMAWLALDIAPSIYLERLKEAVGITSFWIGISKAPVFGFLIALVGCAAGLNVRDSAESVGRQTTQAVVASIFLVIVADAAFSILFSSLGL